MCAVMESYTHIQSPAKIKSAQLYQNLQVEQVWVTTGQSKVNQIVPPEN